MDNFFDKLNTLIRAKLNQIVSDIKIPSLSPTPEPIQRVTQEAENLRKRVNDAIRYEERLQGQIADIQKQLVMLNRQADDATQKGNDAMARYFIGKINHLQERLGALEKDLQEHQHLAQDLIHKVNTLEATIADIQVSEQSKEMPIAPVEADEPKIEEQAPDIDIEADLERRRNRLSKK